MSLSERIRWRPPKPNPILLDFERRCRAAKEEQFLDERLMDDTATACSWPEFRRPRLGRFKHRGRTDFIELLGYGQDGIVWKVSIENHTCALKVVGFFEWVALWPRDSLMSKFWDNHPPEGTQYWALQRECQTASLLEKMRSVIERSSDPIWLNPEPTTFHDAARNLHAFSDEGRSRQRFRNTPGAVEYSTVPHLRKCYGWTLISGKELCALPSIVSPPEVRSGVDVRKISPIERYHAIVYEYVPGSDRGLDVDVVQAQLDFLWLGGWCLVPLRLENWGGTGILLDMGDLISVWHAAWFSSRYKRRYARELIQECL